jgi:hypothetical protein
VSLQVQPQGPVPPAVAADTTLQGSVSSSTNDPVAANNSASSLVKVSRASRRPGQRANSVPLDMSAAVLSGPDSLIASTRASAQRPLAAAPFPLPP